VADGHNVAANAGIRRRLTVVVLALALLGAASFAVSYFQRQSTADRGYLSVAGNVRAETFTVRAPAIALPTPDYTVGIPGAAAKPVSRTTAGASGQPVVSGRLAEVYVAEGERVVAGQKLARLDTVMLDLGVEQAEAAAAKARADIDVLSGALDTISSSQADLAKAKRDLQDALAKAKAQRDALAAQLKQLESMPTPPPGVVLPPGTPNPAVLIPQLKAGLAKLDAAIAKMEAGLRTMASGSTKLANAKTQARNGRELLGIVAETRDIATGLAKARRDWAVITAPIDGLVTFARSAGGVAMVNAPLFRIAPDTPVLVDTYLTAEQLARVRVGDRAEIAYDSSPGTVLAGRITGIADSSAFPPTTYPTDIVHMTRATRVTITLDDGARPPAGTPVDITIRTDSPASGTAKQ
jgi:multidrug resistance efflux pump